jgi:hypothetical protein
MSNHLWSKKGIVMTARKYVRVLKHTKIVAFLALSCFCNIYGTLSNLTTNDSFSFYSTKYPYNYLSRNERVVFEKIGSTCYDEERFRFSITPFTQWARKGLNNRAEITRTRNEDNEVIDERASELGDIPERLNVVPLFYDEFLKNRILDFLGYDPDPDSCFNKAIQPKNADPNNQFGRFSVPLEYKKSGVRFELILKLWENCFNAIGLKAQTGVAHIRQYTRGFRDLSCNARGLECTSSGSESEPNGCSEQSCCIFPFRQCDCKNQYIPNIANRFYKIAEYLDYDIRNFYETRPEDLKLYLWYRDIIELNATDPFWPRVVCMPFFEAGVGIPLTGHADPLQLLALPFGNNGHTSAGVFGGLEFEFIDNLDFTAGGGVTKFFKQDICNMPLPTHELESKIYPYKADVEVDPGYTAQATATIRARNLIDRLSVWFQFMFLSHSEDRIKICRSYIPEESDYYPRNLTSNDRIKTTLSVSPDLARRTLRQGFLVDKVENLSKWETNFFNIAFNYDISPDVSLGMLYQHSYTYTNLAQRRNTYCNSTLYFSAVGTY